MLLFDPLDFSVHSKKTIFWILKNKKRMAKVRKEPCIQYILFFRKIPFENIFLFFPKHLILIPK